VNWAAFHPTLNLIVSGADDQTVKLWRMNNAKAWEVDSLRGHTNNVSCVAFHPKSQQIISNSEDMTIKVFDMSKQSAPLTLRRGNERYWILATHPTLNLIAAGHDKGLIIFKLNRERPPLDSNGQVVYFYKAPYVYEYNVKTKKETPIVGRRRQNQNKSGRQTLSYNYSNRSQHCVLISDDSDGSFELFTVSKTQGVMDETPSLTGFGRCAVFVSSTRFAVLDKQRQVWLKSLKNEYKNKLKLGDLLVQAVFAGGIGRLLLRTNDHMVLYDVQALKVIKKLNIQHRYAVKYVVWSEKHKYVAMFSKMQIIIATNKLEELCSVSESTRIKSGQWDRTGVFIYSTSTHIKYVLPNGDQGVIRTIEQPLYITSVKGGVIYFIDRENVCGSMTIDCSEFLLKLALMKRRNKHVLQLMQGNKMVSQSILAYLQVGYDVCVYECMSVCVYAYL
jgi:coatomer protein complex subunit alpha (xenin)